METSPPALPFVRWAARNSIVDRDRLPLRQLCDHLLVLGVRGRGTVTIENHDYDLQPERLFLLTPGMWYGFSSTVVGGFDSLAVHFDWSVEPDSGRFATYRTVPNPDEPLRRRREFSQWPVDTQPFLDLAGRPRILNALTELVAAFGHWDDLSPYETGAMLAVALSLIERETRLLATVARYEHVGADAVRRIETARRLLESLDGPAKRVADVAAAVGWSPDHLRRMCRAVLGTTPIRLQRDAVIRRAKELLANDRLPIAEVASYCSGMDQAYFARIFKEETGMAPGQYRASLKL
ncbi:MAG TPA: helix-turn-helix transcriptional regulator [Capsulimonadaceae bacterium]